MDGQHRFWQRALRFLSLGIPSGNVPSALADGEHSFQQEMWLRTLRKEQQKKQIDMSMSLDEVTFMIIDMETTGFSPQHGDEILAMAAAKTVRGAVKETYYTLVCPEKAIPPHISALTGITAKDVQYAPRLHEVLRSFLSFISGGVMIGYHIGHDLSFLNHFLWTYYRTKWTARFLDMQPIAEMVRHRPFPSLDAALQYYGISCEKRHTADGDVQAMAELWARLLQELKNKNIETLYDLYSALSKR
ncbi:exonuclease domain-containing protein [Parageobacillus toebii]|uniref:DNA polymerase III alpha subunit n=1 Tax=Parageobacillus toebii TaxID=153151 RepID=A0A150N169_9BACL|nr:exonuclease domain-containing protein [Parageobacillus toebii]KYD30440.1 DNA polymerase III alpha subunit [Parageobacillus toebii]